MHIRRLIVALLFTLLLAPLTYAQVRSTMTDDQVMSFIMRESQKGTPRSAIMTKLVERGVTVDQVRRIRRKYEMQSKSNSTLGAKDLTGFSKKQKDRLRQQNGEETPMRKIIDANGLIIIRKIKSIFLKSSERSDNSAKKMTWMTD